MSDEKPAEPRAPSEASPAENPAEGKRALPNLVVRLATAAVGIPIILWMLYWAPSLVFAGTAIAVAGVGGSELAGMVLDGKRALQVWLVLATMAVTTTLTLTTSADALLGLLFGCVVTGALAGLASPDPMPLAGGRMAWLIAGPLYIGGSIAALAKLHQLPHGGTWVLLSMALAWGSDTGGYFAGRALGRHKLYEKVSPKKTIEGSIGGLVTVVLFAIVIRTFWLTELSMLNAIILALVAGAIGQAGDLCVSVVKRSTGTKDSGKIIPGHGGLLDRADALMFTAIVTLLYARFVLGLSTTVPSLPL
ncbi:phosphatidate cytidylyltransferase [uncultured bacterium]|nr:phosphatidate cytidylyltransferase [uncultured bacterium]